MRNDSVISRRFRMRALRAVDSVRARAIEALGDPETRSPQKGCRARRSGAHRHNDTSSRRRNRGFPTVASIPRHGLRLAKRAGASWIEVIALDNRGLAPRASESHS